MTTKPDISVEAVEVAIDKAMEPDCKQYFAMYAAREDLIDLVRELRSQLTEAQAKLATARDDALEEARDCAPELAGYIGRNAYNDGFCEATARYKAAITALKSTTSTARDDRERDLALIKYARTGPWRPDIAVQIDENILTQFINQEQSR